MVLAAVQVVEHLVQDLLLSLRLCRILQVPPYVRPGKRQPLRVQHLLQFLRLNLRNVPVAELDT